MSYMYMTCQGLNLLSRSFHIPGTPWSSSHTGRVPCPNFGFPETSLRLLTQFHLSMLNVVLDPNPNPKLVKSRSVAVKNLRWAYLEKVVQNGEYFSEEAMREREPYLHYELVGRYQDPMESSGESVCGGRKEITRLHIDG